MLVVPWPRRGLRPARSSALRGPWQQEAIVRMSVKSYVIALIALWIVGPVRAAGPSHVDLTWMSISNIYYELGPLRIMTDGYFTRLPQSAFFGGGGGVGTT